MKDRTLYNDETTYFMWKYFSETVIILVNGICDSSSNLAFHFPKEKLETKLFSSKTREIVGQTGFFNLSKSTSLDKANIIIIIIMSCRQHGYPWPSLATSPYHSSPPAGLQGYILCPHIDAVCKFGLVVLLLHGHMWGSIGVHHLRARPCFSSSVRRVWLV